MLLCIVLVSCQTPAEDSRVVVDFSGTMTAGYQFTENGARPYWGESGD